MSVDYADLRLADEYWCCGSLEYKNAKETRLVCPRAPRRRA